MIGHVTKRKAEVTTELHFLPFKLVVSQMAAKERELTTNVENSEREEIDYMMLLCTYQL